MHRNTSHYAISKLIFSVLSESGLRAGDFVLSLGYKNKNKGVRVLDRWLQYGEGSEFFLGNMTSAHGVPGEAVVRAIAETDRQKENERLEAQKQRDEYERRNFRPYIYVETSESRPSSIMGAVLCGAQMKFIEHDEGELDEGGISEEDIGHIVRRHYLENKGKCFLFGDITGYRFVKTYEGSVCYDVEGRVLGVEKGHFRVPFSTSFGIRKKSLDTTRKGLFETLDVADLQGGK